MGAGIFASTSPAIFLNAARANVRVFGSAGRGTDREDSDVDLLVDVDERATLFTLTGLEQALSELPGIPVDVRTPAEISRHIRDRVLAQARPLADTRGRYPKPTSRIVKA